MRQGEPAAPQAFSKQSEFFDQLEAAGYDEVKTPLLVDRKLWEASGHWAKYRENMYITEIDEEHANEKRVNALKPMNCPCHVQIFRQGIRSYRDLPLRMAEFGACHRYEPSGALHGLLVSARRRRICGLCHSRITPLLTMEGTCCPSLRWRRTSSVSGMSGSMSCSSSSSFRTMRDARSTNIPRGCGSVYRSPRLIRMDAKARRIISAAEPPPRISENAEAAIGETGLTSMTVYAMLQANRMTPSGDSVAAPSRMLSRKSR